ncbi:2-keto-4-pentenoate hydratase [Leuconostoc gasicomitatum]|uniref:2-keto-4-pentenoate hydratase n=1 Tax=Leuconostoc gasicomitatum TaxID=115778 RepID=UPI001CC45EE2|nr:2-keto-4-pentenoate hydratase [Leuconostoc gasicomitatum]MBZ5959789.1 2-keto-4-pentenoate hydratase [Leuconostoc gasicomitatum]MBZ5970423.1 2-keto-4-pentenoate hydratase [Leuconostoc gasicomitatum]MBZ5993164.1 2-keto-4-pentenoate hydratase [Leuconostoc gasicomitatum]MBZ5997720.1 2-keto-4-pentenoate hydratase [Leuconostoc gasicomitatum]
MTLTLEQEKLVQHLFTACQTNKPLDRDTYVGVVNDFDTAYAVQDAVMFLKEEPTAGYKVSLTSPKTQAMFDSNSPLYGAQIVSRFLKTEAALSLEDYNEPLVEVELQFTAKSALTVDMDLDTLLVNTTVAPTLEVPDSRFENWFPTLDKFLVLSDSAVGGAVVSGAEKDGANLKVTDLVKIQAELTHNGHQKGNGFGSEVLGNPLIALQWLVRKLAEQGKKFPVGTRASTGTFMLPFNLVAGEWRATFSEGFGDVVMHVTETK